MKQVETIEAMRAARRAMAGTVAFVPTMGALHAGHRALVQRAREIADHVVVSIFVNPTQFAPHEDFDRYPRPMASDLAQCKSEDVDLVFAPTVDAMYPPNVPAVTVDVPALGDALEGEHRPGFFGGVCRVVAKLLEIVQPDIACFGMKDYQQLRVIEAMAAGLCMAVRIEACATVREPDGLALSSRNVYLDADQRRRALGLSKALREAERLVRDGELSAAVVEQAMAQAMAAHQVAVDYAAVRDARTLKPIDMINVALEPIVCLAAGRVDAVRLIDNVVIRGPR